ncbi:thioesterase II family protein [Nonomuraea lactucae]|uniref:thioesterase II family protein n=1 Tax=Nonomuraea lactucae TaxID=2249762 RepID=UPI000DE445D6|nr:alpha/beta fold hydrolase [Nonomuraea lactucae]
MSVNDARRWVRRFGGTASGGVRLVCFPHAGGAASSFLRLSRTLAPGVDVLSLQYPGRQDRNSDPHFESIPGLAHSIFTALRGELNGPYAFFGHSMGALVAFETARLFERHTGGQPVRLFVSGCRAPSMLGLESLHRLDDDGLVKEIRRLNGTAQDLLDDTDILKLTLPIVRSDYKAVETYVPDADATVTCPITILVGDADPVTTVEEAGGWRAHTTGDAELRIYPGGHFYLNDQVSPVAKEVLDGLAIGSGAA